MLTIHSRGGESERLARGLRLTRRRLLGASGTLAVSSTLLLAIPAAVEASLPDVSSSPDPGQLDPGTLDPEGAAAAQASLPDVSGSPDPGTLSPEGMTNALQIDVGGVPIHWTVPMVPDGIIDVPYRTQFDGSPQARANCGPAALAMMLARYGDRTSIADIRRSVNDFMMNWRTDNGATWEALVHAAQASGYQIFGLFASGVPYRRWSVEDLAVDTSQGDAVMILVRYRALPGHGSSAYGNNHYVVVVGAESDGSIVYHDPAFPDAKTGSFLKMSRKQLGMAWSTVSSGIAYSGMVIRPKPKK